MKLTQLYNELLNEVGDGSSQPFVYFKGGSNFYIIRGVTSKGDNIDIDLTVLVGGIYLISDKIPDLDIDQEFGDAQVMYISFKIESINGEVPDRRYKEINDIQYMYRLMATLKEIMLPLIEKKDVDLITYSPSAKIINYLSDSGKGRDLLYKLFIKKEFPNSEMYGSGNMRLIILNK
jgi:hypothetical protein